MREIGARILPYKDNLSDTRQPLNLKLNSLPHN